MSRPKIQKRIEFELFPHELAKAFCSMDSYEQAKFFNHVAELVEQWDRGFCFQLQAITDETILTDQGRSVMRNIGEYADRKPEQ